jgi:hypothetical protein
MKDRSRRVDEMIESDFIDVCDGLLSRLVCAELIHRFEETVAAELKPTSSEQQTRSQSGRELRITGDPHWVDAGYTLNAAMMKGLVRYVRKYPYTLLAPMSLSHANAPEMERLDPTRLSSLSDPDLHALIRKTLRPGAINLQKYASDTQGDRSWHCELYPKPGDFQSEVLHRTMLWTFYLNDNFDCGETEFFHQRRKVVPKAGSLLLAPAAFTHTHKGHAPRGGDKYIATSWILFQRPERLRIETTRQRTSRLLAG